MRPFVGLTTLLVLGLLLPSFGTVVLAQTQPVTQYVALGDSIAFGTGSSLPAQRSYPVILKSLIEAHSGEAVEMTNLAAPGETAESFLTGQVNTFADIVQRLLESNTDVDLVTISLGGNEMLSQRAGNTMARQQALGAFRQHLEDAVARIRAEVGDETILVLTTYYDLGGGDPTSDGSEAWWVEQFNQVIRDTAERHGAIVAEVADVFRGQITDLTHHPYDVHPNNQGFRAIAQQVWSALAFDQVPPDVRVLSHSETNRRTPTLQFSVTDNVDVADVSVEVGDRGRVTPIDRGDGRYAVLLDLRGEDTTEYTIVIEARDSAGNVSRIEQQVVVLTD